MLRRLDIEFLGGAKTVTGSMHMVHTPKARVLLECGLFQGRRRESYERNRTLPFRPSSVDAVVLSHAHIDHSGLLPMLIKGGYRGAIYCTPATRDLCAAMLEDAAFIQMHDARYLNRKIDQGLLDSEPIEPLYDRDDVVRTLSRIVSVPYRFRTPIADGVELTLLDAGHVLGSSVVVLDVDDEGAGRRVVFSGDLGRAELPILRDPEVPDGAHFLITESTYGDRNHPAIEQTDEELAAVLARTHERGGKVVIPSFALERAQEIIFALKRLRMKGRMPYRHVYVDSPLTVRVTEVFKMHPECYDGRAREMFSTGESPFEFEELEYVQSVEDSKRITGSSDPAIIISASGMCESGRVLHHLKSIVSSPSHSIVIVGWQAQHTLGRRLVEGRRRVRIFGVERDRHASVTVINGFSAHADQDGLVEFATAVRERGPLRRVALVHGEPPAQSALIDRLENEGFPDVHAPAPRERMRV